MSQPTQTQAFSRYFYLDLNGVIAENPISEDAHRGKKTAERIQSVCYHCFIGHSKCDEQKPCQKCKRTTKQTCVPRLRNARPFPQKKRKTPSTQTPTKVSFKPIDRQLIAIEEQTLLVHYLIQLIKNWPQEKETDNQHKKRINKLCQEIEQRNQSIGELSKEIRLQHLMLLKEGEKIGSSKELKDIVELYGKHLINLDLFIKKLAQKNADLDSFITIQTEQINDLKLVELKLKKNIQAKNNLLEEIDDEEINAPLEQEPPENQPERKRLKRDLLIKSQQSKLISELNGKLSKARQIHDQQTRQNAELQNQLARARQIHNQQTRQNAELQNQLARARQIHDLQSHQNAELQNQLAVERQIQDQQAMQLAKLNQINTQLNTNNEALNSLTDGQEKLIEDQMRTIANLSALARESIAGLPMPPFPGFARSQGDFLSTRFSLNPQQFSRDFI